MKVLVALILALTACAYSTPIDTVDDNVEEIAPTFNAQRDIEWHLTTRTNRVLTQRLTFQNLASINNSNFNRARQTRFVIHGWLEDRRSDIGTTVPRSLLDYQDFNVIFVDWSAGGGTLNYAAAANRVTAVGQTVAAQIDWMNLNVGLDFNRLTIIGFSLGAHCAGHTGKNVRRGRINQIIGLDPAGPLFSVRVGTGRIDAGDARYVECIHTNGPGTFTIGLGIGAPICHSDFFPNGGQSQPGCLLDVCSHERAVDFYAESVANNRFQANLCASRDTISSLRCRGATAWMGGDDTNFPKSLRGSYFLETNRSSPFAQGPQRR